jgi:hypothetical protein
MTAWISSSVAVGFITIIISRFLSISRLKSLLTGLQPSESAVAGLGTRPAASALGPRGP